jgi:hypothetical protein
VIAPAVVILPMRLPSLSVNQSAASGPAVIPVGVGGVAREHVTGLGAQRRSAGDRDER